MSKIEIIDREVIAHTKFLDMIAAKFKHEDSDKVHEWYYATRGETKAVMIVPVITEWKQTDFFPVTIHSLILTKEYRVPIGDYEWGFPAGLIDGNETPEVTIARELLEETGYRFKKIITMSPFVYNSAGLADESISIAVVEVDSVPIQQKLEGTEDISVHVMNQTEVKEFLEKDSDKVKFGAKAWIYLDIFARYGKI